MFTPNQIRYEYVNYDDGEPVDITAHAEVELVSPIDAPEKHTYDGEGGLIITQQVIIPN